MGLVHSLYAVYGVELDDADWLAVDEGLQAFRRTRRVEDVHLHTVSGDGGPERVVIGVGYEELMPGTCKQARDFSDSADRDELLRLAATFLGCRTRTEPGWLLVHDWS